jgi:mono/diheme cytochrome c family protein
MAQGSAPATADSLTTLSRVYTTSQSAQGRQLYLLACVSCHSPGDHTGGKFWTEMVGKTLGEFFGYLRSNMPKDNAGSISDDDYVNVTAYILQLNTMPAGERLLPADSATLAKIRVVPPDTTRKGPGQ